MASLRELLRRFPEHTDRNDVRHRLARILEERKEFIRAFVQGLVIDPDKGKGVLHIRRFPAPGAMGIRDASQQFVAGARYKHQKRIFPPIIPPVEVEEISFTYSGSALVPA